MYFLVVYRKKWVHVPLQWLINHQKWASVKRVITSVQVLKADALLYRHKETTWWPVLTEHLLWNPLHLSYHPPSLQQIMTCLEHLATNRAKLVSTSYFLYYVTRDLLTFNIPFMNLLPEVHKIKTVYKRK